MVTTTRGGARKTAVRPEQVSAFNTGNEMAAVAAKQVNYHIMGY